MNYTDDDFKEDIKDTVRLFAWIFIPAFVLSIALFLISD